MKIDKAANALKELGHPTRLMIFKYLVKGGDKGLPVGVLQKELQIPHSTLSHHVAKLISVGLISQKREGRTLWCIPNYTQLNDLIDYLKDECCINA